MQTQNPFMGTGFAPACCLDQLIMLGKKIAKWDLLGRLWSFLA